MGRNKKFLKDTAILFIGKFTSQFMGLLLIPLFTYNLAANDYGAVDLLQTVISLFIPVLSLRIDSAVFRYLIDCREDDEKKRDTITNTMAVMCFGIIVSIVVGVVCQLIIGSSLIFASVFNLIILLVVSVLMQVQRGLGRNKEYSICCIIIGASTLMLSWLFVCKMHLGAESILWSSSLANLLGAFYIVISLRLLTLIDIGKVNKKEIRTLLKYSVPMIPDYLSGWVVNVSDRTIVSLILGTAMNGIYTVACKFSNALNSIFTIVNMSWQETASIHINDLDRDSYFTHMMNDIVKIFSTIGILMLVSIPFIFSIAIGEEYLSAYCYMPVLIYANTWRVLVGVTSGIYVALKKTKEVARTTVVSAIINVAVNLSLIGVIGLHAAAISTLVAYTIMGIYRYIDCKKYINLKIDYGYILSFTALFAISTYIYMINNPLLNGINILAVFAFSIVTNIKIFKKILLKLRHRRVK